MTLSDVSTALLTVSQRVRRYTSKASLDAPPPQPPYIVWSEDMQSGALHGDGVMVNQTIQGTIDLFSKTAGDPYIGKIQKALNDAGIGFRLNSVQFEEDTRLIHHEWVFEIETEVS